ncbi:MAG: MGH1-like glycoside hydrolase domain-containing protein [Acidobacteriaceae bacterium]
MMRFSVMSKLLTLALAAGMAGGVGWAERVPAPELHFHRKHLQATLGAAYRAAVRNLMVVNTVPVTGGKDGPYDQTGLLKAPMEFVRAGGGYDQPWTRDASVNSWNAASLLEPEVARNTLWAVVKRGPDGRLVVQQDKEWWDQIVWVTAAWHFYEVSGDREFLRRAYETAVDTLRVDREKHYNARYGLFEGPAFLNDGIAGYPAPPADKTESRGSFVLDYPGADRLMALSTNCLYVAAYENAARMAKALGRPAAEATGLRDRGERLAARVRARFRVSKAGRFGYLIHGSGPDAGKLADFQEGSGEAFAVLFGVATPEEARAVVRHTTWMKFGVPDVWPNFARYSLERPGRHNAIVWPMVEGFWGDAAARAGDVDGFARAMSGVAGLALGSGGDFYEIYNGTTGRPDGGWQVGTHWKSQPDQTWSASAYLRMVFTDLFGMRFRPGGIAFQPTLPRGWGPVQMDGVRYRGAVLTVELRGSGDRVKRFRLDGKTMPKAWFPAGLTGRHTVEIVLGR